MRLTGCIVALETGVVPGFAATAVGSSSSFIVGFGAGFTGSCFAEAGFTGVDFAAGFAFFSSLSSRLIEAGFAGVAEAVFSSVFGVILIGFTVLLDVCGFLIIRKITTIDI